MASTKAARTSSRTKTAFHLTRPKLTRLDEVVRSYFLSRTGAGDAPEFQAVAKLSNGRRIELGTLALLFDLDNGPKNSIRVLSLSYKSPAGTAEVSFDGNEPADISAEVVSDDAKWSNELFAAIEEQTERVRLRGFPYSLLHSGGEQLRIAAVLATTLGAGLSAASVTLLGGSSTTGGGVTPELKAAASAAQTTDEKIDVLFRSFMAEHSVGVPHPEPFDKLIAAARDWHVWVVVGPVVIVILIALYTVAYCYPAHVFEWGDQEEHHARLVARRRTLWNLIGGSFLVGVLGNVWVYFATESFK